MAFVPIAMGIAAVGSAIGNIISNRKRKKELKRQQELADTERSNNQPMYEKDYYKITEAKAALKTARKHLAEEGKKSAQASAIVGGSNERFIAQKEASNKTLTNLLRSIAGQGQSFKNSVFL